MRSNLNIERQRWVVSHHILVIVLCHWWLSSPYSWVIVCAIYFVAYTLNKTTEWTIVVQIATSHGVCHGTPGTPCTHAYDFMQLPSYSQVHLPPQCWQDFIIICKHLQCLSPLFAINVGKIICGEIIVPNGTCNYTFFCIHKQNN